MKDAFQADLQRQAQSEADALPPTDMERIVDEFGNEYQREDFDKLVPEVREQIKAWRGHLVQLIAKAGWLGTLEDGRLVDRRVRRGAKPMPKNGMFGCPEPKELPAEHVSA